jgi:hypothetical protein
MGIVVPRFAKLSHVSCTVAGSGNSEPGAAVCPLPATMLRVSLPDTQPNVVACGADPEEEYSPPPHAVIMAATAVDSALPAVAEIDNEGFDSGLMFCTLAS